MGFGHYFPLLFPNKMDEENKREKKNHLCIACSCCLMMKKETQCQDKDMLKQKIEEQRAHTREKKGDKNSKQNKKKKTNVDN